MARSAPSRQAARAATRRAERRAAERGRRHQERTRRAQRSRLVTARRRRLRRMPAQAAVVVGSLFASLAWAGPTEPFRQPYLPPAAALGSYRVTYSVTYEGGVHNTEQITVDRPFGGVDVTYRQGKIVTAELTNPAGLWDWSADATPAGWFLLSQGRQRSLSDAQTVQPLDWGIDRGLAAVVGTGRVLGRPCTRVLTGQPVGQPVQAPDGSSSAELCIDRTGIPLHEVWHLDGKVAEVMNAVSFDPHFVPDSSTFAAAPRAPSKGPPPVIAVALSAKTRRSIKPVLVPPRGFSLATGYVSAQQSSQTGLPDFSTRELYVSGTQLLELDYVTGAAPRRGITVSLPGGRQGYLSLDLYASALSVDINPDASLIMYATDPSLLIRAADRLHW